MKKNYISSLLVIAALALGSCTQNLDIEKHGNMGGQDDFYTNDANIQQGLANLYNQVLNTHVAIFAMKNYLSDDVHCGGGGRGDNASSEQINEYTFGAEHGSFESAYGSLYSTIYCANLIIDKVEPTSDFQKQAVAEARVLRAWAHAELASLWGTPPVVDHLLTEDEYKKGNSQPGEIWEFVISELKSVTSGSDLRSKSSVDDKNTGVRITKEAALSFLGKAQLLSGDAAGAAATLESVIKSGKYDLFRGDYRELFHASTNNCCEAIFECEIPNDSEKSWDLFGTQMGYFTIFAWRTGLMESDMSNPNMWNYAQGGWGFCNPLKELYQAFEEMEGKDGYRKKQIIADYADLNAYGLKIAKGLSLVGCDGYWFHKHQTYISDCSTYPFVGFPTFQYTNFRIMRYAEVLLLAAEANISVNPAKATEYLNMIRERAGEAPLNGATLEDVKKEKRLELCMEGCRFQDLVRWGDAEKYLANQGKEIPTCADGPVVNPAAYTNAYYGFKKGKHELLPIPFKEIQLNPNMVQNPGW